MNDDVLAFNYSTPYADGDEVMYHGIRLKAHMMPTGQLAFLPVTVGNTLIPDGMEVAAFEPPTVTIGDAEWMAGNLAIDDGGDGIYFNPENGEYYYTWDAAMRIAEATPGWHLPSTAEWNAAAEACGATMEYASRLDSENYRDYAGVESLRKRLEVKLAGYYFDRPRYIGYRAYYWSSVECCISRACCRYFDNPDDYDDLDSCGFGKCDRMSVRLVKDSGASA